MGSTSSDRLKLQQRWFRLNARLGGKQPSPGEGCQTGKQAAWRGCRALSEEHRPAAVRSSTGTADLAKGQENGPADLLRCHPALIVRCNETQSGFYATVKARIKAGRRNVGCLARSHPCSREKAQHILLSTAVSVLCRKITHTKKYWSVTEMPKMFTLDKRQPRFSGCERWRCLRLSLNRQVSLPVKNIL